MSFDSILHTLTYIGAAILLYIIGVLLFTLTTKMNEKKLIIEQGNIAVALKLGGKLLGLAIVVFSASTNSVSLLDMLMWGVFGIIAQIIVYLIIEYVLFPKVNLAKKIEEGNVGVGAMLFMASICVGLAIAGSLSYDPLLDYISQ